MYQRSTLTEACTVRGEPRCASRLPVLAPVRLLGAIVERGRQSVHHLDLLELLYRIRDGGEQGHAVVPSGPIESTAGTL